jgi:hypothetical protein
VNGRRVSGSVQPDLSAIAAAAESGALCLERRRIKSYPLCEIKTAASAFKLMV